jgi:hypothetical protein
LQAVNAEAFSEAKLRVLESACRNDYFLVGQLRRVIDAMTFSDDKIKAVRIIAPRLLDRENIFTIYTAFTFDSDKQRARTILEPR